MSEEEQDALVSEYAISNLHGTVTLHEAMDENREGEIAEVVGVDREIIREQLSLREELGPIGEDDDAWDRVTAELSAQGEEGLSGKITALKERIERPYPSLVRIRVRPDEPFEYVPGQYARLSFEEEEPRVYSLASSPTEDELEFCIRRVPGGNLTPDLCDRVEEGDDLFVRGPYGDEFLLQDPSPRDMAFVATGTGVAPFRGMLKYVFDEGYDEYEGEQRDVWLVLGASWKDQLPYREFWRRLDEEHDNFHAVLTVSRENYLTDWTGETAYVQNALAKHVDPETVDSDSLSPSVRSYVEAEPDSGVDARIDAGSLELYVCGIGVMATSVRQVAESLGVADRFLEVESYG